jgi:hypothetical protein
LAYRRARNFVVQWGVPDGFRVGKNATPARCAAFAAALRHNAIDPTPAR